ncbi:hypothetical protein B0H65DRAFT_217421 [Neurospora tetraspora]|uniref:NACHT-NTPase and P-loop NTPases N-terminal domain-containing protein n=1 Tax=Neurospora tetraspora TaxID=94610 RepID=A0AAE0JBZ4_9PEZI|nr:hypothetical protein B0H65DRAFT_217421 [Neurospora tetraspora]
MSGLEVLSVASSIISIVDAVSKVINTLRLAIECMNQSQHGNDLDDTAKKSCSAMVQVLKACQEKAALLGTLFEAILPPGTTRPSARKRFTTAVIMTLHVGKSRKVESLMKGILQDIQLLANNRALDEATRGKMKARIEMNISAQNDVVPSSGTCPSPPATRASPIACVEDHKPSVPSVPSEQSSVPLSQEPRPPMSYHQPSVFRNYGTGTQNVHSGRGNQNINSGQGYFFSGTVTGPIHFSTAASC